MLSDLNETFDDYNLYFELTYDRFFRLYISF